MRVSLPKFEYALLMALGEFWPDRPPKFELRRPSTGEECWDKIDILLKGGETWPDYLICPPLTVRESELNVRTAALVRKCAQTMVLQWTQWTLRQLGEHDLVKTINAAQVPYERLVRNFPMVPWDPADIFDDAEAAR